MTFTLKRQQRGPARDYGQHSARALRLKLAALRCHGLARKPFVTILIASFCWFSFGCSTPSAHEPVTLTFLDVEWDTPDRLPELARNLQDFTQQTGILVKRLPRPDGSLDQLSLWRQQLEKRSAGPDIVSIDVIWSAMLSQYLLDLRPYFGDEISSQNNGVLSSYTVGGKVVAIPHHAYVGVLFYRPNLLRRYGYTHPPATWDELEAMAARIQTGERARGRRDFWGYVWQGGVDEDLTCSLLELQMAEGGGRIIEEDKTISVNNPQAIRAWQRAAHWVGSISPPAVVAYSKWDAQNVWESGRAAFVHGWASNFSVITRGWPFPQPGSHAVPEELKVFGVTSVPGAKAGRVSTLGGNGLAVSQSSAHPAEAMQLIRFLLRRDRELINASAQSEVPREISMYELPVVLDPYPQLRVVNQHGGIVVARPSVAVGDKYEQVTRAYIEAVHSVLTGEQAPSLAAASLETRLAQITGFPKSPPANVNVRSRKGH